MQENIKNISDKRLAQMLVALIEKDVSNQPRVQAKTRFLLLEIVREAPKYIRPSSEDDRDKMRQILNALCRILTDTFGVDSSKPIMNKYYSISMEIQRRLGIGKPQHLIDKYGC